MASVGRGITGTVVLEWERRFRCVNFYDHKSNAQKFQKVRSHLTCSGRENGDSRPLPFPQGSLRILRRCIFKKNGRNLNSRLFQ
jgi:hypothetical protein